jgi:membrane associated rhomboid family serine protease
MNQPLSYIVLRLVIVNAIVFVFTLTKPAWIDVLALHHFRSPDFQPYQLITYMFTHGGITHFAFNMMALASFGPLIEQRIGPLRTLILYFVCGLGAVALHWGIAEFEGQRIQSKVTAFTQSPDEQTYMAMMEPAKSNYSINQERVTQIVDMLSAGPTDPSYFQALTEAKNDAAQLSALGIQSAPVVGASGSIYGFLALLAYFFPFVPLSLMFLPFQLQARYFIPLIMVIELFLANANFAWDNIGHYAHIGGALFGMLLVYFWRWKDGGI